LPSRDQYEVVHREEASRVLAALARRGDASANMVSALTKASAMLAPDWRAPFAPDGLVLLRRIIVAQSVSRELDAPITPSQMKAMLKKSEWIEIEVKDAQGKPYSGPYAITLTDGRRVEGTFDEDGLYGNYDLEPGTCKLVLRPQLRVLSSEDEIPPPPAEDAPTDESPPEMEDPEPPLVEPPVEEREFVATLVDYLGNPVVGVPLLFSHAGTSASVATDSAGVARHRIAGADSVEVGFADPAALAEAMRPIFTPCSGVARDGWIASDATTNTVTLTGGEIYKTSPDPTHPDGQTLQPFNSAPTSEAAPARLSVQPLVVVARLLAKHFDLNKCFLLPTALASPQEIVRLQKEYHQADVLITGHTDTSAAVDYNLQLSVERATAMRDYLTNNVDGWLPWYGYDKSDSKRWGTAEDTYMIGSLVEGTSYPATVLGYQQWHNAAASPAPGAEPLAEDGILGPMSRRQLILDYMNREGSTVPDGTTLEVHGCGEYFPLDSSGTALDTAALDGQHESEDRRVEVYFFPKELGILPPVPGPTATRSEPEYPEWRGRSSTVVFVAAPALSRVDVRLTDELDQPLAGIPLAFSGGASGSATTDTDGRAFCLGAGPGTVVRLGDEAVAAEILRTHDPKPRRTVAYPEASPTQHVVSLARLAEGIPVLAGIPVNIMVVLRTHLVHTLESTRWTGLSLDQPGPWSLEQATRTTLALLNASREASVAVDKTSDADLPLDTGVIPWLHTSVVTLHEALLAGDFATIWDLLRAIPLSVASPPPAGTWPGPDHGAPLGEDAEAMAFSLPELGRGGH
jgi:outer membrane protein OmpA-like peptidoglycan-associated protein